MTKIVPATEKGPNIHQRIRAVMQAIGYVQKDKTVGEGKFAYQAVTHDNVIAAVRQHLIDNGISMNLTMVSGQTVDSGKVTSSGTKIVRFEGVFNVTFTNVDEPSDFITETIPAHGEDAGDKATGKAVSYAKKYALLTVLMLETGVDDESRTASAAEEVQPQLAPEEMNLFAAMIAKATTDAELQGALKPARKKIAAIAGDYKGHAQWVSLLDAATKRKGFLAEAAKAAT